jgi:hypothetical protein
MRAHDGGRILKSLFVEKVKKGETEKKAGETCYVKFTAQ